MEAVAVLSYGAKLRPKRVMLAAADEGELLTSATVITGASYVKMFTAHAATELATSSTTNDSLAAPRAE